MVSNKLKSNDQKLDHLIKELRAEYGTVIDWIIADLENLEKLGYNEILINTVKKTSTSYFEADDYFNYDATVIRKEAKIIKKYKEKMPLRNLAHQNLIKWTSDGAIGSVILGIFEGYKNAFIEYVDFQRMYVFLERLYFIQIGQKLDFNNLMDVYFGGLAEHLTFTLEEFDKAGKIPEPTNEFFHNLSKVRETDETINFFYKSHKIIKTALSECYGRYGSFGRYEKEFISYLAGCSAVKHNRNQITIDDYLTAYKTYYKLLKTDVTQYRAKPEILKELGLELPPQNYQGDYLVCDKCGGYYQLQPGEFPDDFRDVCECGGKLEFKENLESD